MLQFLINTRAGCRRLFPRHLLDRITTLAFCVAAAIVPRFVDAQPLAANQRTRPNIVLIMADDMGFSDLGCYGAGYKTPNLDSLAAGGLRFTQFYNTGRCWPTRASLLTGLYPHQAGHAMKFGPTAPPAYQGTSRERGPMISEVLGAAGYRCYHSGKWHLETGGQPNPTWPLGRGFDRSYYTRTQSNYFNPRLVYDDHHLIKRPGAKAEYYQTDAISDHAVHALREHAAYHSQQPFFLYLAYTAPHFPLHAKPEDIEKYRGRFSAGWDKTRQQRLARMRKMGIVDCELSPRDADAAPWESLTPEEKRSWTDRMALHVAMIHCLDQGVGRVVRQLKEMQAWENTLVLFLSDNGASAEFLVRGDGHDPNAPAGSAATHLCLEVGWANASNTPFRFHKMWVHEGGIATPLIAHWPRGISARGELTHAVGHVIDIMPTCAELAGANIPAQTPSGKAAASLPGSSLASVLQGGAREPPAFLFWEHVGNRAIRQGDWKLVAENEKPWELYNLQDDRSELHDLAAKRPELAAQLAKRWQTFADATGVVPWNSLPQSRRSPGPNYRRK